MAEIQVRSPAFNDDEPVPSRYAHDHENVSPPLRWSDVPESTTELVLLCEDPDAPAGSFLHWLVTGIDPAAEGVSEGETPPGGREWANGFGEQGWGGPQPPVGDHAHHYVFHLYALADPIRLPAKPSADDVHRQVERASILASAITVGTYQR
jgi:Raf kinase inhibitor-like YbhB/YbcL family protein